MPAENSEKKHPKVIMFLIDTLLGMLLKNIFSMAGYEVKAFYSYQGAVETVIKEKPDVLICDVLLDKTKERVDKIGGFDAIKTFKANKKTADVPVVILSDLCYEENVKRGLRLGAEEYLCLALYPPYKTLDFITNFLIEKRGFEKEDFNAVRGK
jgi:two-component system chemotaxis sensor kinase CheA